MKKFLSILLSAVIVLSIVPLSVFSVSADTDEQGVKYVLDNKETYYTVSGYVGSPTKVVIPAEFNGYPVEKIGTDAFLGCSSLTSIEIPDSVTSIGWRAFVGCSLESITVSSENTVYKSVGNCLIEIATKTLELGCKNSMIPTDGSVTSIGDIAFADCFALTNIVIPDTVINIGSSAFYYCENLTRLTIGNSVTNIGSSAFSYCSSLTSIEIPDTVTSIYSSAFSYCNSLTNIRIGNSVTNIGNNAFYNCTSLSSIEIPDSVTAIGGAAFSGCTSLSSIEIPDSVTAIGGSAFSGCTSLSSIEIPDSVTAIGGDAFSGCTSLSSIEIPDSVTSIDALTFSGCFALTSIVIPDSVREIGGLAFDGCLKLSSIEIPDSVVRLNAGAFSRCSGLTSIEIPDSVIEIGLGVFSGCSSLENITVTEGNTVYHCNNNCLIETETKTIIASCKNSIIPNDGSVTAIGVYAFNGCSSLTSIEIPDTVTSIENQAFQFCFDLTSIEIPDTVTSIGKKAFSGCDNLTDIYCEAESQPEGWVEDWLNGCDATVHWGYTSEVAAGDLESEISNTETNLIKSDYAEEEWADIQEALNKAKDYSTDGKNASEIRDEIDALKKALELNPKLSEFGDLDGDEKVSSLDYLFVKRSCLGTYELTDVQTARADIDRKNEVNSLDYLLVKRMVLGTYSVK